MRDAEHDVDDAGERGVDQRVLDVERAFAEDARVVRDGVSRRAAALNDQIVANDSSSKPRCGASTSARIRTTIAVGDSASQRRHACGAQVRRRRAAPWHSRFPRIAAAESHMASDRDDDQHDRDDVAHRVGNADRGDAQIGLRRQHVLDVEQERRREVVEDLDEDQRGAGEIARHGEREDDAAEQAKAGASRDSAPPPPSSGRCCAARPRD